MTTDIVAEAPHWPAVGVKVYVLVPTVAVFIVAGLHVPVTPLVEVVGKAGAVEFWHKGPTEVKVGVTCVVMTTAIVTVDPH
jgi:hypothetical protein